MRLIIQKAGVYNDVYLRAHKLQPGDVLDTRLEYGRILIANGFAINEKSIVPAEDVHEEQPSDNARNENAAEADADTVPEIELPDDADENAVVEFVGKSTAARKRTKKA